MCKICVRVLLTIAFYFFQIVKSSKRRSWLGPTQFLEGIVPTQRIFHGLVAGGDRLYVFGGYSNNGAVILQFLKANTNNKFISGAFLNDLQLFDPAKAVWTDITPNAQGSSPSPRRSMGFAADDEGKLYVFGGTDGNGKFNSSITFVVLYSLHPKPVDDIFIFHSRFRILVA